MRGRSRFTACDQEGLVRTRVRDVGRLFLPLSGIVLIGLIWFVASRSVPDLPSPVQTWNESRTYVLRPFEKRGEMDQGIARLASYSLVRVSNGFLLGIALPTPLGLLLGVAPMLQRTFV